jgi:molybdopterin/thiamine biosynthesis adenylyltransferase
MNHPLIIGAGGVASYLLPVLLKTFRPAKLTIIDKDVLEERNLDRQMFHKESIGQLKAQALVEIVHEHTPMPDDYTILDEWFSENTTIPDDIDGLICVADNHEARHATIQRANALSIMAYIGGNEYFDSQAYAYHPEWAGTPRDPLVRYPNIATSHEGSPFRCQGDAQIAEPQLAIANLSCASKLLHLLWLYERWLPENRHELSPEVIAKLPYELFTSLHENSLLS